MYSRLEKGSFFILIISLSLIALGLTVIFGWWQKIPYLVSVDVRFVPVFFNTAICILAAGLGLFCSLFKSNVARTIQEVLGTFLIFFAGLALLENIFNWDLHIDNLFATDWINYQGPSPGRIPAVTSVAFILTGLIILLLQSLKPRIILFTRILIVVVFVLAIMSLTAHLLGLDFMTVWNTYTRMSLRSTLALLLLSIGLWIANVQNAPVKTEFKENETHEIGILFTAILFVSTLIVAIAAFAVMFQQYELSLAAAIQESLQAKNSLIQSDIERPLKQTDLLMKNPLLVTALTNSRSEDKNNLLNIFEAIGYSGVKIVDSNENLILSTGNLIQKPLGMLDINLPSPTTLLWTNDSFYLRTVRTISTPKPVKIMLETKLPEVANIFHQEKRNYDNELVICKPLPKERGLCITTKSFPNMINIGLHTERNQILPMLFAFQNQSGGRIATDYTNRSVLAAYTPVANYGLGMVYKLDLRALLKPLIPAIATILPILLLTLLTGIALLYYRVTPLITKIINSEKKIRNISNFQQALLNGATYTIIATDNSGLIQIFNKAAEHMLGYKANEVIGKVSPGIFHDPELIKQRGKELTVELGYEVKGMDVFTRKARMQGADTSEWVYIRKNGSSYPVLLTITPLYDDAGRISGYMSIGMDITERKKIDKMKNEFISIVSHELRTPLTAIQASLDLLNDNVETEIHPETRELLEIAKQNSERLARLINDVLDVEKIESGNLELQLKNVKIDEIVQEAIIANQAYAEKFGTSIKLTESLPGIVVNADHDRLLQVLTNLLSNAVKFSLKGAPITVAIRPYKKCVRVAINNKGSGIPKEFKSRIFEKFSQADSSISRKYQGTGLGLSISKAIIELMHGKINFESKFAEGTTFYFDLPIVHENEFTT